MNPRFPSIFLLIPIGLMASCAASTSVDSAPVKMRPASITVSAEIPEATETTMPWLSVGSVFHSSLTSASVVESPDVELDLSELSLRRGDGKVGKSYTQFKVGVFEGSGDLNQQDSGYWAEVVFGRELMPFLALEGTVGYISSPGPIVDVWMVPFLVQGRVQIPILILEAYGGIGIGGAYVDTGPITGFGWAGDVFLGLEIGLGNLALGLEGRFFKTSEIDNLLTAEGSSVMLTLKLPF